MTTKTFHIDFNGFGAGTVIDDELEAKGLQVAAFTKDGDPKDAMIFDTAYPSGGDDDLATTNLKKVLIISEDGDACDPDDEADGGTLVFSFHGAAKVKELTFLDIEEGASIKFFDEDGDLIEEIAIPAGGNNDQFVADLDVEDVHSMAVTLNGSGAIDDLKYALDTSKTMDPFALDESHLIAEYLFEDDNQGQHPIAGRTFEDTATALDGVAQTGTPIGSPNTLNSSDVLDLDGKDDAVFIAADENFQIGQGAVSLEFNQDKHMGDSPDTLISRDSSGFDDGGHLTIQVTEDGRVTVRHQTEEDSFTYKTGKNFFAPGDDVRVLYQWDDAGVDGRFVVQNLTTNKEYEEQIDEKLTLDMGPDFNEPWTIGASQKASDDNVANELEEYFNGQIDTVRIYDLGDKPKPDGVVDGTSGDDLIDVAYDQDPDGDFIDAGDAIIPGEGPDDDIVWAGNGNDTVISGPGDDAVYGECGDDELRTGADDDLVVGGEGNDTIFAGPGDDQVLGGDGEDKVDAGAGDDIIMGGDGNDDIWAGEDDDVAAGQAGDDKIDGGASGDDVLIGGSGKDTITGGDGSDLIIGDGEEGVGPDAPQNLIVKGSFEDLTGLDDNGGHFTGPDGEIPGWTDPSGNPIDVHIDGRGGIDPVDGQAWLDTEGTPKLSHVGQDVAGVEDGQVYILSFSAADYPVKGGNLANFQGGAGAQNEFDVIWNGEVIATINPSQRGGMEEYTFAVEGGSGDGSNRLEFSGKGPADNIGAAIDNVSLVSVADDDRDFGDHLFGDDGDDTIFGQGGDDTIVGGEGEDDLSGGADRDVFRAEQDDEGNVIPDAAGSFIGDSVDGGAGGDDHDTLDLRGTVTEGGRLKVTETGPDSNDNGVNGFVEYFDADDNLLGQLDFEEIEKIIVCFTPGTAIATPRGEVPVESLEPGDRVITRDNGIQEIAWVGARDLTVAEMAAAKDLRPVLIKAGALGPNLPERDMLVSPQHRMLMANERNQLFFDEREVLVAAKHLVGMDGVTRVGDADTTYIHFMCEKHEVVLSDGTWTESFQPGDYTLTGLGDAARNEIFAIFPELATESGLTDYVAARKSLKRHEAALLTVR